MPVQPGDIDVVKVQRKDGTIEEVKLKVLGVQKPKGIQPVPQQEADQQPKS